MKLIHVGKTSGRSFAMLFVLCLWCIPLISWATDLEADMCPFQVTLGSFDASAIDLCGEPALDATTFYDPAGQVIAGAAERRYLLSTQQPLTASSIVAENSDGSFVVDGVQITYGTVYYLYVAISEVVQDSLDLTSDCLTLSSPKEVGWFDVLDPNIRLSAPSTEINCDTARILLSLENWDREGDITWYRDGAEVARDSPILEVNQRGTYRVLRTREGGRCSIEESITITEDKALPDVDILPIDTITCRRPLVEIIAEVTPSDRAYTYSWTGPKVRSDSTLAAIMVSTSGRYTLTVTDVGSRCQAVKDAWPPEGRIGGVAAGVALDSLECDFDPPIQLSSRGSTPIGGDYIHIWERVDPDGLIIGERMDSLITVGTPGPYRLIVRNRRSGCEEDIVVIAPVRSNIKDVQIDVDQPSCPDAEDGQIRIAGVRGGMGPYIFSFDGGETYDDQLILNNVAPGIYEVMVQDVELCEYTSVIEVRAPQDSVTVDLGEEQSLIFGDTLTLTAATNIPSESILEARWSPPGAYTLDSTGLTQRFILPDGDTRVRVVLVDADGCLHEDDVLISVVLDRGWFIPTALRTSSAEEANRFSHVYADPSRFQVASWSIYDRWGSRVFHRTDYAPSLDLETDYAWTGIDDGDVMLPGVYPYELRLQWEDGRITRHTGVIHLID